MALAKNIVSLELLNTDKVHLFREEIFYKAYERSAYAFVAQRVRFQVQRKYMKTTVLVHTWMLKLYAKNITIK